MAKASRYRWVALWIAFISQMSNGIGSQAVAPLAPLFQPELGLSKAEVGFFSSAAFIGTWGVLLVAGALTDRFGVRSMMSLGQIVTGLFMLFMSGAASFLHAVVVMFASGVGRGGVSPGVTKAVMLWFPPEERATAMGLKQAAVPMAGILTASTLPAMALAWGWRSALVAAGILIIASGLATAMLYRNPAGRPERLPERRPRARVGLRRAVFQNRGLWIVSLTAVLFSAVQVSLVTYLALYFAEIVLVPLMPEEPARVLAAGGYLALSNMGGVFGRIFWGVVSDRIFHGRRQTVLAIIGALAAVSSVLLGYLEPGESLGLLTAIVILFGAVGNGWAGLYLAVVTEVAGRSYAGTAVGLSMTLSQLGNVGGPVAFGFLVDLTGSYRAGWLFLGVLSLVGALMAGQSARQEKQAI